MDKFLLVENIVSYIQIFVLSMIPGKETTWKKQQKIKEKEKRD